MKLLLKALREGLGRAIILGDYLTRPSKIIRDDTLQKKVDDECQKLAIYQFYACPFCIKVRRNIHRLAINIELKNAQNAIIKQELLTNGGKVQVPCLQINSDNGSKYIYESNAIIAYLENNFNDK